MMQSFSLVQLLSTRPPSLVSGYRGVVTSDVVASLYMCTIKIRGQNADIDLLRYT